MTQEYLFHVEGMNCRSCVATLEEELGAHALVRLVKPNLAHHTVLIRGDFGLLSNEEIVAALNALLSRHRLGFEKVKKAIAWQEFLYAVPIALAFVLFFIMLQKLGIINLIGGDSVGYGTAFLIGIIASLSTCMAVIGGLLLSLSATYAREESPRLYLRDQLSFHLARLIAFFILGGAVGVIGSFFQFGVFGNAVLGIVVGIVMLVLGMNLLDVWHATKKWQLTLPKGMSTRVKKWSKTGHQLTPILVGIATFFLPCGFTQSMQVYSLSTGSFAVGAFTMFFFALGTLPVLALISFGFMEVQKSKNAGIFFKSAGIIVMLFALFNIINSLAAAGMIAPVFRF